MSGTFTAVINIIAIAMAPNIRTSAIYYFITALFVLLACFDTYFALPLNVCYCNIVIMIFLQIGINVIFYIQMLLSSKFYFCSLNKVYLLLLDFTSAFEIHWWLFLSQRFFRYHEAQHERAKKAAKRDPSKPKVPYFYIFKKAFPQLFNVFMVFFVTLAVFPAVLAGDLTVYLAFKSLLLITLLQLYW